MSTAQPELKSTKILKRSGITGIAIGALALLACELPILLAIIGVGGLSTGVMAFRLPLYVEIPGIILFVTGIIVLSYLYIKRKSNRKG